VVDKNHYVRQDRRLDGKPFIFQDNSTAKARTVGTPSWPVGIPTAKEVIMLREGSSDFLAAYSLAYSEDLENRATSVAILGASNVIRPDALQHFHGKRVLGFPDYDAAGITGMSHWRKQIKGIATPWPHQALRMSSIPMPCNIFETSGCSSFPTTTAPG
jgi:hypothetical protein